MSDSRKKAIRLTIITAAVSLLLSEECCVFCAAFILNVFIMAKPAPAPAEDNYAVTAVICGEEAEEPGISMPF